MNSYHTVIIIDTNQRASTSDHPREKWQFRLGDLSQLFFADPKTGAKKISHVCGSGLHLTCDFLKKECRCASNVSCVILQNGQTKLTPWSKLSSEFWVVCSIGALISLQSNWCDVERSKFTIRIRLKTLTDKNHKQNLSSKEITKPKRMFFNVHNTLQHCQITAQNAWSMTSHSQTQTDRGQDMWCATQVEGIMQSHSCKREPSKILTAGSQS